eukprot:NODE_325_length_2454_cov_31.446154_g301_i0.p1 GENE.NODE_325_length_2454_cov_31.446154_g301_i0~~NODE_325_length_2454_cov_31.446154_g301_i0.p1  ORF type:complete len:714 (+),score=169.08 NODE_325_length_2454_cov_31.446154_g301_i0:140-2281(+)
MSDTTLAELRRTQDDLAAVIDEVCILEQQLEDEKLAREQQRMASAQRENVLLNAIEVSVGYSSLLERTVVQPALGHVLGSLCAERPNLRKKREELLSAQKPLGLPQDHRVTRHLEMLRDSPDSPEGGSRIRRELLSSSHELTYDMLEDSMVLAHLLITEKKVLESMVHSMRQGVEALTQSARENTASPLGKKSPAAHVDEGELWRRQIEDQSHELLRISNDLQTAQLKSSTQEKQISLHLGEISSLRDQLESVQGSHRELIRELESRFENQLSKSKAECSDRVRKIQSECESLRQENTLLRAALDRLHTEVEVKSKKIGELTAGQSEMLSRIQRDTQAEFSGQLQIKDTQLQKLQRELDVRARQHETEVERLRSQGDATKLSQHLHRAQLENEELKEEIVRLQSNAIKTQVEKASLAESFESSNKQLIAAEGKVRQQQCDLERVEEYKTMIHNLRGHVSQLQSDYNGLLSHSPESPHLRSDLDRLRQKLREREEESRRLQNQMIHEQELRKSLKLDVEFLSQKLNTMAESERRLQMQLNQLSDEHQRVLNSSNHLQTRCSLLSDSPGSRASDRSMETKQRDFQSKINTFELSVSALSQELGKVGHRIQDLNEPPRQSPLLGTTIDMQSREQERARERELEKEALRNCAHPRSSGLVPTFETNNKEALEVDVIMGKMTKELELLIEENKMLKRSLSSTSERRSGLRANPSLITR